ncbi:MAG: DHHA1 domain-containing protein, partial [Acidimicrobiia bacterium]|nr:DHHA1 domain-containing protein [Acidimicrobiia bacterium]
TISVAALERLGSLATNATNAATLIVIDHHASNEGFGDLDIIDPTAGAAGQLAYALIGRLGWDVTPEVATALLAAIVADTGRFQYSSTTSELMRIGADLVDAGAHPTEVGQNLFEKVPFGYLQVMSVVAARAELDPERSLVWSVVFHEDLKAGNITYEHADGLIDNIRIANEAEVALLLKEVEAGFKGSLRSRGRIDVCAIAAGFGGGGHHNAAGFSHPGPLQDIVAAVKSHLDA